MRRAAAVAVLTTLAIAGCGGGGDDAARTQPPQAGASADQQRREQDPNALPSAVPRRATGPAPAGAERVIRGWLAAVRAADFRRAATYFTVPAVVQNVSPPVTLRTRRTVVGWNASLPCGARLTSIRGAEGGWAIVRFRLVERRRGDCGTGTGASASSAILVADGRIRAWHRLPDAPSQPAPADDGAPTVAA